MPASWACGPTPSGLSGQSSGGHLAMLAAMRPADPCYAAIPSPEGAEVDASVRAVVMQWPVINPLSRYRNAVRLRDSGNPPPGSAISPTATTCTGKPSRRWRKAIRC